MQHSHLLPSSSGSPLPERFLSRLAGFTDLFTCPTWSNILVLLAGGPASGQKGDKRDKKDDKDVVVAGKKVTAWIKALEGKEVLPRMQAINALRQAGPEARRAGRS